MYAAGNGNVGVGTTTPSCKFQITSSTNNFTFKPNNSGNLEIDGYDGNANSTIYPTTYNNTYTTAKK